MQHMHGIVPYLFDSWPDAVVHLLLLKSYMHLVTLLSREFFIKSIKFFLP